MPFQKQINLNPKMNESTMFMSQYAVGALSLFSHHSYLVFPGQVQKGHLFYMSNIFMECTYIVLNLGLLLRFDIKTKLKH